MIKNRFAIIFLCVILVFSAIPVLASPSATDTVGSNIKSASASLKLNKKTVSLREGSSTTLKATVKGKSKKVTWKSSDTSVATVKNGIITAKKAGKCVITAKANVVTAKCKVTVLQAKWKKAYAEFLRKSEPVSAEATFQLVYLSGDEIPELMISEGAYHAAMAHLYTYSGGKVQEVGAYGDYGYIDYVKKKGKLSVHHGNRGFEYYDFYLFNNECKLIKHTELSDYYKIVNGTYQAIFEINGKSVSQEVYNKKLCALQEEYGKQTAKYSDGCFINNENIHKIFER